METKQNEKTNNPMIKIIIVLFVFFIILISVLVLIKQKENNPKNSFTDCKVINENCIDESCKYINLCIGKDFQSCKIYDCVGNILAKTIDKNDKELERTFKKVSKEEINDIQKKCEGSIKIINTEECVEKKARAVIEISTVGQCEIKNIIMNIDGKARMTEFTNTRNVYNIVADKCGKIEKIKAISKQGLALSVFVPEKNSSTFSDNDGENVNIINTEVQ